MRRLQRLSLSHCGCITTEGIAFLAVLPCLRSLDISGIAEGQLPLASLLSLLTRRSGGHSRSASSQQPQPTASPGQVLHPVPNDVTTSGIGNSGVRGRSVHNSTVTTAVDLGVCEPHTASYSLSWDDVNDCMSDDAASDVSDASEPLLDVSDARAASWRNRQEQQQLEACMTQSPAQAEEKQEAAASSSSSLQPYSAQDATSKLLRPIHVSAAIAAHRSAVDGLESPSAVSSPAAAAAALPCTRVHTSYSRLLGAACTFHALRELVVGEASGRSSGVASGYLQAALNGHASTSLCDSGTAARAILVTASREAAEMGVGLQVRGPSTGAAATFANGGGGNSNSCMFQVQTLELLMPPRSPCT